MNVRTPAKMITCEQIMARVAEQHRQGSQTQENLRISRLHELNRAFYSINKGG